MRAVPIERAGNEDGVLRGRPSANRIEWEAAREADAQDLNRRHDVGGKIAAYVVPLWSNADAERCLRELRGFDQAPVYLEVVAGEGMEEALAAVAESEWAGSAFPGVGEGLASFLHLVACLEIPVYLEDVSLATKALALALGEDLTPREIEIVLRGEWEGEPDAEASSHARELLNA